MPPLDLPYSPPLPALTVFLTLAALPLASALRGLGGETAHRPLPAGWSWPKAARFALALALLWLLWCLLPLALRPAALALEGALARDLATLSHRAWQATALLGALALALWRVSELRWPARALRAALSLALAPPLALALGLASHPALGAAAAPLLLWSAPRLARGAGARWRAWRRPAVRITRQATPPPALRGPRAPLAPAQAPLAPSPTPAAERREECPTRPSGMPAQLAARLRHDLMELPTRRDPL